MDKLAAILGIFSGFFLAIDVIGEKRVRKVERFLDGVTLKTEAFFRFGSKVVIGKEHPDAMLIGSFPKEARLFRFITFVSAISTLILAYYLFRFWTVKIPQELVPKYFGITGEEFLSQYSIWLVLGIIGYLVIFTLSANFLLRDSKTNRSSKISVACNKALQIIALIVFLLCLVIAIFAFSWPYIYIAPAVIIIWCVFLVLKKVFDFKRKHDLGSIFKIVGTILFIFSAVFLVMGW